MSSLDLSMAPVKLSTASHSEILSKFTMAMLIFLKNNFKTWYVVDMRPVRFDLIHWWKVNLRFNEGIDSKTKLTWCENDTTRQKWIFKNMENISIRLDFWLAEMPLISSDCHSHWLGDILVADIKRWGYLVFRFLSNFTDAIDAVVRRILLVGKESLQSMLQSNWLHEITVEPELN